MQYSIFAKRTILSNDKRFQLFAIFSSKHLTFKTLRISNFYIMFFIDSFIERVIETQINELVKMLDVALNLISKQQKVANQTRFAKQRQKQKKNSSKKETF